MPFRVQNTIVMHTAICKTAISSFMGFCGPFFLSAMGLHNAPVPMRSSHVALNNNNNNNNKDDDDDDDDE